ncbi:Aldehyde/histidinol dehydrogenase, partial [Blyttiomyces helicus]
SRIPVLGHADGLCSVYIDESADEEKAVAVVVDSKTNYPAACNSTETLLIHASSLPLLPAIARGLLAKGVTLRGDPRALSALAPHFSANPRIQSAEPADFDTEFLDLTIAVRVVESFDEAVAHVNAHGSHHTEAIVTENEARAEEYMRRVDAAGVYWNASTRFADGFRYGFGAEIGVSTNKTHARGPVGLEGLVIYKYRLYGKGQTAGSYGEGKKKYLHEPIPLESIGKRFAQ